MNSTGVAAQFGPWSAIRGKFTELSRKYHFKSLAGLGTETKIELRCRLSVEDDGAIRPFIYLNVRPNFVEETKLVCAMFAPSDDLLGHEILLAKVEPAATGVTFIVFDIADGEKLLSVLMLGRQITLRLIDPDARDSIAIFLLENDITFRREYEALKRQVDPAKRTGRVDFSEWSTDRPGLVARKYTYSQINGIRDFELEVHFDIQAGLSIYTFVNFLFSDLDLPREMSVRVSLHPMDGSGPAAVMTMRGTPSGRGAVLNLANPDDVRECLKVFFEGKGMSFEVDTISGEKLIRLPLPNDDTFQAAYRASYEKVRPADGANFKGEDAFIGRLNRFFRGLSGR